MPAPSFRIATLGVLVSMLSVPLFAQAPTPPAPPPALSPETTVRVETSNGARFEGRFERYRGDSLLVGDGQPVGVPINTITSLWVRGHATKRGMVVGGAIGLPLGVLLGAGLCEFERTFGSNAPKSIGCTEHYIGGTAFGAAVGIGIGALVGRLIPRWHLRFRIVA
jgi:ElaB/YqjD/DUF883 family membrane-anchored ribosome-binding protein